MRRCGKDVVDSIIHVSFPCKIDLIIHVIRGPGLIVLLYY